MRKGQNPAKMGLLAYHSKRVGIALLSSIPDQDAYSSQSLEILKYQVASVRNSFNDCDLVIFDNGSCLEVQAELKKFHAQGLVDVLILSRVNFGKTGAMNWLLASLPNELIVYADGDVLFRPGWFEAAEKILNSFPKTGLVTSQPCLFDILRGNGRAWQSLENDPNLEISEKHLKESTIEEYARGIGLDAERIARLRTQPVKVAENRMSGVQAVVGASHIQFLMRRDVARKLIPLPCEYALNKDEDAFLNQRIDQLGLWQLSTVEPFIYHMGNRLDENDLSEIQSLGLAEILNQPLVRIPSVLSSDPVKQHAFNLISGLSQWAAFRNMARRLYNLLFEYFAQEK